MADLITQDYLTAALADYGLTANQTALLPALTAAASRTIRDWCNRQFTRATYDELYSADPREPLILREYPVNAVLRLSANPTAVISISQTNTATNQRATAMLATSGNADSGLTVTGLTLNRIASGVTTTATLLFATSVTLNALAAAVAALNAGWTATVCSGYGLWPTADLRAVQGAKPCMGSQTADFKIHVDDLSFELDEKKGIVSLWDQSNDDPFDSPRFGAAFTNDYGDQKLMPAANNLRVVYDAGFDTIPESVQLAAVELVKASLERLKTDSTLVSETDGTYSWTGKMQIEGIPFANQQALALYRNTRA